MTATRVCAYPADRYACGHYRVSWPAQAVAADGGFEVTLVPPGGATGMSMLKVGGETRGFWAPDCDVVVLQRPARRIVADMVPLLRERGVAVVVDIDDDLERIHPSNPAFLGMHPRYSPDYNWEHVRRACREATLVTVSTPALAERFGFGHARVIRNYVPERLTEVEHDAALPTPGWAGSAHSHPGDLRECAAALSAMHREGYGLRFVGPRDGVEREVGVELHEDAFTGDVPFGEWVPAIAERIGVGVAPLAPTTFNEAKSWLKPLEYAAAGVPFVASATGEYRKLAGQCGLPTASRPKEWLRALRRLVTDEAARREASEEVRDVARQLTVERHAHLWAEAWEGAVRAEHPRALV